jgi:Asp-tRNA(Asn)/Glu-tRNA(Gln) amidotransferase B subunit
MGEVMPSMIGRADPAAVRARLEAALAPVMEDANRG